RLLLERHVLAEEGRLVDGVEAVEPVSDPAPSRFEKDDLQAREAIEVAKVEERRERVADAIRVGHAEKEAGAAYFGEALRGRPRGLERRMDGDWQVELLRDGEHRVMIRMAMGLPCKGKGRDECAAHPVRCRALELAGRGVRIA